MGEGFPGPYMKYPEHAVPVGPQSSSTLQSRPSERHTRMLPIRLPEVLNEAIHQISYHKLDDLQWLNRKEL